SGNYPYWLGLQIGRRRKGSPRRAICPSPLLTVLGEAHMSMGKFTTMTLAAVMVVAAAGRAEGQQLSIRRYGVSDGLAHNGVRCVHQDAKGYIWFGTQEGLSRFDGYRFINYGASDGLNLPFINTIAEDRRGRLWVGTNGGGVARFLDDP